MFADAALPVPAARSHDLVMTEARDELLVYDQANHHIHHLNPVTAAIWRTCDGSRSLPDIAQMAQAVTTDEVSVETVRLALTRLESAGLLDGELQVSVRVDRHARRAISRRAAVAGAIATPLIVSVTAPSAAAAESYACPGQCGSGQLACCKNSDECKDMLGGDRGDWNCTGGGQVPGVPKGCCVPNQ